MLEMSGLVALASLLVLLFLPTLVKTNFKEKTSSGPRERCSFLKSLTDKQCREPELENGISINVKKEQCYSKLTWHKIKIKGCRPKKVLAKDCIGKCNSIWFPGPEKGELGCFGCFPADFVQLLVNFECPKRKPKKLARRILFVKNCKCRSFKCIPVPA